MYQLIVAISVELPIYNLNQIVAYLIWIRFFFVFLRLFFVTSLSISNAIFFYKFILRSFSFLKKKKNIVSCIFKVVVGDLVLTGW